MDARFHRMVKASILFIKKNSLHKTNECVNLVDVTKV